ncbi:MAG: hypothetical protein MAG451_03033 [Anaerolineales bacterium]|nr:hypothetical protein [Anaerolineales bacterium]
MTIGDIADRLGVPVESVRNWADTFADFLSQGAVPAAGEIRRFTVDDVELLAAIAYYSIEQQLDAQEIRQKLEAGDYLHEDIPAAPAKSPSEEEPTPWFGMTVSGRGGQAMLLDGLLHETQILAEAQRSSCTATTEQIATIGQRIEEIESHLGALEQIGHLQTELEELHRALRAPDEHQKEIQRRVVELRDEIVELRDDLVSRDEVRTLEGSLQARSWEEALGQLRDTLQKQTDYHTTLRQTVRQTVNDLQSAAASAQQDAELDELAARLEERMGQHEALTTSVQQQIGDLESTLASGEQVTELTVLTSELQGITERHVEREARQLQHLARLGQKVQALEQAVEERQAGRGLRRLHAAFSHGVGKIAVLTISWALFLIGTVGVLYYLVMIMRSAP